MSSRLGSIFGATQLAIRSFINSYRRLRELELLKREIRATPTVKIVLGAGGDVFPGWISTNINNLDITSEKDWSFLFSNESIDNLLAEHVLEHLTLRQARDAFRFSFIFLKPGGVFRIAVPDGLFPSKNYINYVKPGGEGAGADDHKVLYTFDMLRKELRRVGFNVKLLEYWDEQGNFVHNEWKPDNHGMITRSRNNDKRNFSGRIRYTSLIVDACKA